MNVLIIQENGRHDKNRDFRECYSLKRSFEKLNHTATVWGLGHSNYDILPTFSDYDLIINLENYAHVSGNWLPDLSNTKAIKLLWSIDAHCLGLDMFENEFVRGRYDYLLHSTRDFVSKKHHIWFPNSYDSDIIKPLGIPKEHVLGFCGNYVNRKPLLDWMSGTYGLHLDIFVIGDEMVRAINSYKCHFNMNMSWKNNSAINYRNFETIGCGTALLTSDSTEYHELGFIDGVNCFIYRDIDELKERVKYIQNNDISEIAKAGLQLAEKHTYDQRVTKLLEDIKL